MGAAAVASIVFLVVKASAGDAEYSGPGITPANVAALTSEETRLNGVPKPAAEHPGVAAAPTTGMIHVLGKGSAFAFAWVTPTGAICLSDAFGSGGCLAHINRPIDASVADNDVVGAGRPPHVYGIATDEVRSVTARLDDGSTFSADAVSNYYDITLPGDVGPSDAFTLVADLRDGTRYSERVA